MVGSLRLLAGLGAGGANLPKRRAVVNLKNKKTINAQVCTHGRRFASFGASDLKALTRLRSRFTAESVCTLQRSAQEPIKPFDAKAFLANGGIGRTLRHYRPKQIIFSQGERADAVFYIQEGTARVSVASKQGKEAAITLLGRGDFLGEGCIASDQPCRMTTATATTSCSVLKIEKREMLRTLREEHRFSDMFAAYIVCRHNRTQSDLVDQLFNLTEKRLARALLMLTQFGKEGRSEPLIPGISQQALAEMVGTTRSHVNGFIEHNGGLKVHSSLLSVVLHE
jgi:CRP/FNR family transcriptional regulator, cyclic AMP receptor protein